VVPGRARETLTEIIELVTDRVPIDVYAVECALPDLCEYETKVGEVTGRRFPEPPTARCRGIEALRAAGTDHLSVYVERLHQKGICCVAEVRMSDTHHRRVATDEYGCPLIRRQDGVPEVAMDYSHAEVRAHRLAIMRELVNAYDTDGLELNFNRWAKHFERDKGRENAPIMTEFVGQVRAELDRAAPRRNRDRLLLGVRVLSTVDECWLAGCDAETWCRSGWIDYLIVAEHNCTWPGTRVDEFRPFCTGRCELYVQMGDMIGGAWRGQPRIAGRGVAQFRDCYNGMLNTPEEARAAAHNYYAWGADGIAFWNISCNLGRQGKWGGPEQRERVFAWMNTVIDPARAQSGPHIYRYLPLYKGITQSGPRNYAFREELRSPNGAVKGQVLEFPPADTGRRKSFWFRMADGRNGERLSGLLRFRAFHCPAPHVLGVDVNGVPVEPTCFRVTPDPDNVEMGAVWFELDLAACPPLQGDNELGLTRTPTAPATQRTPYVEELEVRVV
jgi:hypothetical protein